MVLYYDHLVTLSDEWLHVWMGKRSGAFYLFLVNRYFAFFAVRKSLLMSSVHPYNESDRIFPSLP